jgi:hypothetical protein
MNKHSKEMQKAIKDSKGLIEVEKQQTKEVRLEIIVKADVEIRYHDQKLQNFKEEKQKLYEKIEMF